MQPGPPKPNGYRLKRAAATRRARIVLGALFGLILGLIAMSALDTVRKVDALATANSDNVQWTLSQVEVELVRLEFAILSAHDGLATLGDVRRRFDVFYNRVDIITNGSVYAGVLDATDAREAKKDLWLILESSVALIDGPDDVLRGALPDLADAFRDLRPAVREIALEGVRALAERSDQQREAVAGTLVRLAFLTTALFFLLGLGLFVLAQMNRQVQRRQMEYQVTAARLNAIVATSQDAVVVADVEGRLLDFNGAVEKIFGYQAAEVLGRSMSDVIVPHHMRDAHEAGMDRYRRTGQRKVIGRGRIQLEARRRSGEVFPVEMSISSTESEEGEIFVAFIRDISARKAAEAELLKARDDALAGEKAKAHLLAVMSHEMRTPLNGLLGTMDLIRDTALDEKQREYLRIMETSGQLLLHHVNDVLDVSRLDSDRAEAYRVGFDLSALVRQVAEMQRPLAAVQRNALTHRVQDGLASVVGDPAKVRQIVVNLLANAIKFTVDGHVGIEAERLGDGDMVEIRVTDDGIGIAEEHLERVFEDFYTIDSTYGRSAGGTGLGLAITARLVRLLGGEIGVESEPGEGSLFWVRLPLPAADTGGAGRETVAVDVQGPPTRSLSVLVVEDNAINRQVVREMLAALGHRVTEAVDGAKGVAAAEAEAFDLILMDISMPQMDGLEATRRIRAGGVSRDAPIVALTAHAMPSEVARFREAGMTDVVTKPMTRRRLAEVLGMVSADRDGTGGAAEAPGEDAFAELVATLGAEAAAAAWARFVEEGDGLAGRLRALAGGAEAAPGDRDEVHRIAGSAAVLGAGAMAAALRRMETALRQGGRVAEAATAAVAAWEQVRGTPVEAGTPDDASAAADADEGR